MLDEQFQRREAQYTGKVGELAYEYFRLSKRLKEIEVEIGQIEAAKVDNDAARRDAATQTQIDQASKKDG